MTEENSSKNRIPESCRRFSVPQRIEHLMLALSFSLLSLTGLVQKYAQNSLSERLIEMMGGIQSTRILHRLAAVVFSLLAIYHILAVAYAVYVRRAPTSMVPVIKDFKDGFHSMGYSLFLKKNPPDMPRYNFAEKLEYWALIWGGVIMAMTGFMLWNPLITSALLPGQFIPAAKAVHGAEAVLAVLAILVWHVYHVHLKMFNKSMITGRMTRHQMEEEHGTEWRGILSGKMSSETSDPAGRRRKIIFIPAAIVFAAGGVGTVYWAATAESTAIETLPAPVSRPAAYAPDAPSPLLPEKTEPVGAPLISHPVEGREQCLTCHGPAAMSPAPPNHQGRPVESCRICHKPAPVKKTVNSGAKAVPAAGPKEAPTDAPKPVPHSVEGPYKDCTDCHGIGKPKAFPENHSAYPAASCTACHK